MKAFSDTSSLLKIYYQESDSQSVEDVLSKGIEEGVSTSWGTH